MLIPIAREAFLPFLVVSFLCGLLFGAIYEVFRLRRFAWRRRRNGQRAEETKKKKRYLLDTVLIAFEDVLFSVFAAITLILVSFKLFYGVPRWYAYGAAFLGFWVWQKTLGALILACAARILAFLDRYFGFLRRRLLSPCLTFLKKRKNAIHAKLRAAREERYTKYCEKQMLQTISYPLSAPKRS